MKKTVKSLIIAASVAAIAGIGAVSFAKWDASNPTPATYGPGTAEIVVTAGTLEANGSGKKLVPYDQTAQMTAGMTTMETITLRYLEGENGASSDAYTYKMALTNDDNLPIYYQIKGETAVTLPEATEDGSAPEGWTLFDEDVEITLNEDDEAVVYLILVSSDSANHMNKGYTVTFSADKV